jgi:hypothetical protein
MKTGAGNPFICGLRLVYNSVLWPGTFEMSSPLFRNAVPADAPRCFQIESSAYEGDEAATFEKIALRIDQYPAGFLIMEIDGETVGFINSGCAHDVVIMSVVLIRIIRERGCPRC